MSNIQPLPFVRASMLDYLDAVEDAFDVVIVGGGATGVYAALDAASRGFQTALFEAGDFASGTSSRSTKLIHGGVRYMQQGRLRLVRKSVRERRLFMDNAPHLVRPVPIVVPAYSRWQRLKYTAGVMGYEAVARGHSMGSAKRLGFADTITAVPGLNDEDLRGGVAYLDGQTDDARLALAIAKTAAAHGAAMLNYARVRGLNTQNGRVTGVEVEDLQSGDSIHIDARVVINATGVFTDETLSLDPGGSSGLMRWSRGTHLVLDGSLLANGHGLIVPETSDGRVVFALPWLGKTLIGTTDFMVESPDADPSPPVEDVEFLLKEIGAYLPQARDSKVLSAFTGIRPLVSNDAVSPTSNLARSHRVMVSGSGLVTVTGGKWTTARLMAEDAVSQAAEVAGRPGSRTATQTLRLHGYESTARHAHRSPVDDPDSLYGDELQAVKQLETRWPELAEPLSEALPYRLSHAVYAAQHEMAVTLEDVLARRTRTLFLNVAATLSAAEAVANAIEQRCGMGREWSTQELSKVQSSASAYRVGG